MKNVMNFLKEAGVFYLATAEGDQPRVRPFGAVAEYDGKLYIITSNQKDVYSQIVKNQKVEISGMNSKGQWIRLTATLVRDDRRAAKTAMLEANPDLRGMYSEDDGIMEVLYFEKATAAICSFTSAPEVYTF
ncbi:MAG: pyridoxamine 5'-phosphate oxidase family protein [Clostridia bacterium]|nr:pyridoxamine 5'-phosphate oxidase family protein [Clostridia bacterium]